MRLRTKTNTCGRGLRFLDFFVWIVSGGEGVLYGIFCLGGVGGGGEERISFAYLKQYCFIEYLSFSLFLLKLKRKITLYALAVPINNSTRCNTKIVISIPVYRPNGSKTISFGATTNSYMGVSPPPPPAPHRRTVFQYRDQTTLDSLDNFSFIFIHIMHS